ncbi:MAG: fumarylacetoacetate hydrolase family protein [Ilumatobacteraceae bacterium]|nr:fumarylacetoacetate hydrolase family protein [Ilumatobacteraceae bacterium]
MRFARIGASGSERPVVLGPDGTPLDISRLTADIDGSLIGTGLDKVRDALAAGALDPITGVADRYGPPLAGIGKIVCVGLNYADHAAETGAAVPAEPVLFLKTPDTVVGANDDVLIPRRSSRTDYEVELAVVMSATARYLDSPADAASVIGGYAISNDVSEREFQIDRGGQWDKGKNCETFNPLGPWLVTADEISDPQALGLRLWVNGELRQDGTTANMIYGVHHLVWYISQFMVLHPGDIINTGTPAGVALGRGGGYLLAGDTMRLEIDGLGVQQQHLGAA